MAPCGTGVLGAVNHAGSILACSQAGRQWDDSRAGSQAGEQLGKWAVGGSHLCQLTCRLCCHRRWCSVCSLPGRVYLYLLFQHPLAHWRGHQARHLCKRASAGFILLYHFASSGISFFNMPLVASLSSFLSVWYRQIFGWEILRSEAWLLLVSG